MRIETVGVGWNHNKKKGSAASNSCAHRVWLLCCACKWFSWMPLCFCCTLPVSEFFRVLFFFFPLLAFNITRKERERGKKESFRQQQPCVPYSLSPLRACRWLPLDACTFPPHAAGIFTCANSCGSGALLLQVFFFGVAIFPQKKRKKGKRKRLSLSMNHDLNFNEPSTCLINYVHCVDDMHGSTSRSVSNCHAETWSKLMSQ